MAMRYCEEWVKHNQKPEWQQYLIPVRLVLSDALRDAGCHDQDTHDALLNGWGHSISCRIREYQSEIEREIERLTEETAALELQRTQKEKVSE